MTKPNDTDAIVKGDNPLTEPSVTFLPDDVVSTQLRDDQLGPDPIVSENARYMGVDYATAEQDMAYQKGLADYIHSGPTTTARDKFVASVPKLK